MILQDWKSFSHFSWIAISSGEHWTLWVPTSVHNLENPFWTVPNILNAFFMIFIERDSHGVLEKNQRCISDPILASPDFDVRIPHV